MKQLGRKLWGVSLLLLLMVVGFQNCSQAQFGQTADLDQTVLSSTEGDSASDSSPSGQLDLVTPRIVLSDRYNGVGKASFSPNQVIYGTVYGVGAANIHVCIGHHNFCLSHPRDIYNYNVPTNKLSNWAYNAADKTWRFQLSYADFGDDIQKISVYDMDRMADTSIERSELHIENYIRISSAPAEAKIYFASSYGMPLFTQVVTKAGNVFDWNQARAMKISGVGKDNVLVCGELQNSGYCNSESNWVRPEQKNLSWVAISNSWQGAPFDVTAGGNYTYYAKNLSSGATAMGNIVIKDRQIVCAMSSSTAVFGPCSDPESAIQCTQANVGYTVMGTGSCRVQHTCKCN